mgnify:CR=1 FL=1
MRAIRNRRGEGYITICVAVIILCMLISIFVTFASAVNIVRQTERNSRVVLDSFVMKNSIIIYNSIKQGNDVTASLNRNEYISDFSSFNSLDLRGNMLYYYDEDGKEQYRLTKPTISFVQDNHLKIQVQYTIRIPLYFAGIKVSEAVIPMTVVSRFDEKF